MNNNEPVTIERNGVIYYNPRKDILFNQWLVQVYEVYTNHISRHKRAPRNQDAEILQNLKLIEDLNPGQIPRIFDFAINRGSIPDAIGMTAWVCHYMKRGNLEHFIQPFWDQLKENEELRALDLHDPELLPFVGDRIVSGTINDKVLFWTRFGEGLDHPQYLAALIRIYFMTVEEPVKLVKNVIDLPGVTFMHKQHICEFHNSKVLELKGYPGLALLVTGITPEGVFGLTDDLLETVLSRSEEIEDGMKLLVDNDVVQSTVAYLGNDAINSKILGFLTNNSKYVQWLVANNQLVWLSESSFRSVCTQLSSLPLDACAVTLKSLFMILPPGLWFPLSQWIAERAFIVLEELKEGDPTALKKLSELLDFITCFNKELAETKQLKIILENVVHDIVSKGFVNQPEFSAFFDQWLCFGWVEDKEQATQTQRSLALFFETQVETRHPAHFEDLLKIVLTQLLVPEETKLTRVKTLLRRLQRSGMPSSIVNGYWRQHHQIALQSQGVRALTHFRDNCYLDAHIFKMIFAAIAESKEGYKLFEQNNMAQGIISFLSAEEQSKDVLFILLQTPTFTEWLANKQATFNWSKNTLVLLFNLATLEDQETGKRSFEFIQRILTNEAVEVLSGLNYADLFKSMKSLEPTDPLAFKKLANVIDSVCSLERRQNDKSNLQHLCERVSNFVMSNRLLANLTFNPFFQKWFKLTGRIEDLPIYALDEYIAKCLEKDVPKSLNLDALLRFSGRLARKPDLIVRIIGLISRSTFKQRGEVHYPPVLIRNLCQLTSKQVLEPNQEILKSVFTICRQIKEAADCIPLFRTLLRLIHAFEHNPKYKENKELITNIFDLGCKLKVWESPEDACLVKTIAEKLQNEAKKRERAEQESKNERSKSKEVVVNLIRTLELTDESSVITARKIAMTHLNRLMFDPKKNNFDNNLDILLDSAVIDLMNRAPKDDKFKQFLILLFEKNVLVEDSAKLPKLLNIIELYPFAAVELWTFVARKAGALETVGAGSNPNSFASERKILDCFEKQLVLNKIDFSNPKHIDLRELFFALALKLSSSESGWPELSLFYMHKFITLVSAECSSEQLIRFLSIYVLKIKQVPDQMTTTGLMSLFEQYEKLIKSEAADVNSTEFILMEIELFYMFHKKTLEYKPLAFIFQRILLNYHIPQKHVPAQVQVVESFITTHKNLGLLTLEYPDWLAAVEKALKAPFFSSAGCQALFMGLFNYEEHIDYVELINVLTLYLEKDLNKNSFILPEFTQKLFSFLTNCYTVELSGGTHLAEVINLQGHAINFAQVHGAISGQESHTWCNRFSLMLIAHFLYDLPEFEKNTEEFCAKLVKVQSFNQRRFDSMAELMEGMKYQVEAHLQKTVRLGGGFSVSTIYTMALQGYVRHIAAYYEHDLNIDNLYEKYEKKIHDSTNPDWFKRAPIVIPFKGHFLNKFTLSFVKTILRVLPQSIATRQALLLFAWQIIFNFLSDNIQNRGDINEMLDLFLTSEMSRHFEIETLHKNLCTLLSVKLQKIKRVDLIRFKFLLFCDYSTATKESLNNQQMDAYMHLCQSLLINPTPCSVKKVITMVKQVEKHIVDSALLLALVDAVINIVKDENVDERQICDYFHEIPNCLLIVEIAMKHHKLFPNSIVKTWKALLIYYSRCMREEPDFAVKQDLFNKLRKLFAMPLEAGWLKNTDDDFIQMRDQLNDDLFLGFGMLTVSFDYQINSLNKTPATNVHNVALGICGKIKLMCEELIILNQRSQCIDSLSSFRKIWSTFYDAQMKVAKILDYPAENLNRIAKFMFLDLIDTGLVLIHDPEIYTHLNAFITEVDFKNCYALASVEDSVFEKILYFLSRGQSQSGMIDMMRRTLFLRVTMLVITLGSPTLRASYFDLAFRCRLIEEFDKDHRLQKSYQEKFL